MLSHEPLSLSQPQCPKIPHHTRQLTLRALIAGMLLGALMAISNLYVALKTGWSLGVTITSGLLAFVIFNAFFRLKIIKTRFGILENNAMQSVASAAGYMAGGGTVAAIPALMLETGKPIPAIVMFAWISAIAMLGVFVAIPMKRQMIDDDSLPFPSGMAAAEMLRSLHHEQSKTESHSSSAQALIRAAGFAALWTWLREARAKFLIYPKIPSDIGIPVHFYGFPLSKWTVSLDTGFVLIAAGALMGFRTTLSIFLGGVFNYGILAPYGYKIGAISNLSFRSIVSWTVWFGASMLLTSGLLTFAFSWRQVARSFVDVKKMFSKNSRLNQLDSHSDEVPISWFLLGIIIFTPIVVTFATWFFHIPWWFSLLCVAFSFLLAIVACRSTGETDTTPSSALSKIAQLVAGIFVPGSVTTNLVAANMSAGIALHSADLLTDLKAGHQLKANPRQQFIAQFFGVIAGSMVVVPAFRLLVPDVSVIGTPQIPAPSTIAWYSVAKMLARGIGQLPMSARWLIAIGGLLGILFSISERVFPKWKKYIPSAMGFGLSFTITASNALSTFLGGCLALLIQRTKPAWGERSIIPISSGLIAGESLIGIFIQALIVSHILTH